MYLIIVIYSDVFAAFRKPCISVGIFIYNTLRYFKCVLFLLFNVTIKIYLFACLFVRKSQSHALPSQHSLGHDYLLCLDCFLSICLFQYFLFCQLYLSCDFRMFLFLFLFVLSNFSLFVFRIPHVEASVWYFKAFKFFFFFAS